jgi:hypothetical protein
LKLERNYSLPVSFQRGSASINETQSMLANIGSHFAHYVSTAPLQHNKNYIGIYELAAIVMFYLLCYCHNMFACVLLFVCVIVAFFGLFVCLDLVFALVLVFC